MNQPTAKRRGFDLAAAVQAPLPDAAGRSATLLELVTAYARSRADGSEMRLRKWVAAFGHLSAWDVTSEQLAHAAEKLHESGQYKVTSINRDLGALGMVYRWARKNRWSPRGFVSPTLTVARFEEPVRRVEVSREQVEALRSVALLHPDRRFGVFVSLLIDTGARKSELLERLGREFDLKAREVLAPTTKTGKPRVLFFTERTAALFVREFPTLAPDRLVFEGRVRGQPISFRKAWEHCTRKVGLPDLHMHDVRHVAAATLLRAGVTSAVAAQVLGHDQAVLFKRYGHLEVEALRQAQQRAWEHVSG